MMVLQRSLIDLCEKAKDLWQKLDPDVAMLTNGNEKCIHINQAVHYIRHHLKLQKKVSYFPSNYIYAQWFGMSVCGVFNFHRITAN